MKSEDLTSSTAYKRFIVLSGPRVGSTLLATSLNSNPDIVCLGEVFNPSLKSIGNADDVDLRSASPADYLRTRIFSRYPDNIRAVGFKFHYHHFWWYPGVREALEDDEDILIVHLERRNLLRILVSSKTSVETGVNFQRAGIRGVTTMIRRILLQHTFASGRTVSISPREFNDFAIQRTMQAKGWGRLFARQQTLPVFYEEMTADLQEEFARIQSFIGVTPTTLKVGLVRQNPQKLEDLIENYAELRRACSGSPSEWMFDD